MVEARSPSSLFHFSRSALFRTQDSPWFPLAGTPPQQALEPLVLVLLLFSFYSYYSPFCSSSSSTPDLSKLLSQYGAFAASLHLLLHLLPLLLLAFFLLLLPSSSFSSSSSAPGLSKLLSWWSSGMARHLGRGEPTNSGNQAAITPSIH